MGANASVVKGEFIGAPKPQTDTDLFAKRLRMALASKGWRAARLAEELGVSRQLAASWTRGRAKPSATVAVKLPGLLGVEPGWLFPGGADAPTVPEAGRSVREPGPAGAGDGGTRAVGVRETALAYESSSDVAAGVAAWLELGAEMQHNLAVKVIKESLEAQDFAGSPVLRALHGIAEKMQEMGYTQMSRHIWAEMGKYFGQQLPPGDEP